ncbi:hypothetical protein pqer_cds_720 [Pandoravirus quercus]|uniref:Uncharacterized protein n=2 Tax=Pandoravirus TaxID=2060084 RepID=A0A2U7U9R8_9VIRU|nr:hypothetical protein pqer_cds_720 [Pandoravirus quercus]AVK75142.1 hypothetical protein pqer_cds_720 [Pandoravirus quercus]QBZ81307.1 hypothetical protein pclt_cds_720 [Pandoravirus celtis]
MSRNNKDLFGLDGQQPPAAAAGQLTEDDDYCLWRLDRGHSRPRFVYPTPGGSEVYGAVVAPCGVGPGGGYPYDRRRTIHARGPIVGRPIAAWDPETRTQLTGEELEGPGLDPRQDPRLVVAGSVWPRQPHATRAANRRAILDVPDRRPITYTLLAGQPPQFDDNDDDDFGLPSDPYYRTYYDRIHWGDGARPPFYRGE